MASDPDNQDERFDAQPPQRKPGMSGGMKLLIILLCVGGGIMLLCCGGCVYFIMKIKNGVSEDPVVVAEVRKDIVEMEIPPTFEPRASFNMDFPFIPKVKFVIYNGAAGRASLILVEVVDPNAEPGNVGEAEEREMQQAMKQQGQGGRELFINESKNRDFTIRGKKVPVRFSKAEDPHTKAKFREISVTFRGKRENSVVLLQLQIPEEMYNEVEIEKMLNSIK